MLEWNAPDANIEIFPASIFELQSAIQIQWSGQQWVWKGWKLSSGNYRLYFKNLTDTHFNICNSKNIRNILMSEIFHFKNCPWAHRRCETTKWRPHYPTAAWRIKSTKKHWKNENLSLWLTAKTRPPFAVTGKLTYDWQRHEDKMIDEKSVCIFTLRERKRNFAVTNTATESPETWAIFPCRCFVPCGWLLCGFRSLLGALLKCGKKATADWLNRSENSIRWLYKMVKTEMTIC